MGLTFSVRNNPGVYALLVGSGISREAAVPTGWEVISDLVGKVAKAEGEEPEPDPIEWYREEYGSEPKYNDLLEELAPSKEDRQALLQSYFEPTDEERERGIKTPSKSHQNIAWLMKNEYIDVVITTNFDRLLETALQDLGVTPTVISKPGDAKGAAPLAHEDAVVLKVNGDYKASILKNTADELESYDPPIERLIKQVLDEYGLVVCGWSGSWDSALRELILSAENRRYSMYWASYSSPSTNAEELVKHRNGSMISIDGADEFFYDLKERVHALENADSGAPLSKQVARERAKRYLTRPEHKIDLSDLIRDETNNLQEIITANRFNLSKEGINEVEERLAAYEEAIKPLASIFSTCAYWQPEVENSATQSIQRSTKQLTTAMPPRSGPWNSLWEDLAKYPTTLLIYALGVAAVESENWPLIYEVTTGVNEDSVRSVEVPLMTEVHPLAVSDRLSGRNNRLRNRMEDTLFDVLPELFPNEQSYREKFNEFYELSELLWADQSERLYGSARMIPGYRYTSPEIIDTVEDEGEEWGPIQAGMFGGSLERVGDLLTLFEYR
ncbi:SIR2 family protein [Halococcus salsus]|uniref:SIR2 family protein n=1 Tax=Halococcus salsus TaxID=2162894 RepID=UPI0013581117|nr:SIR2 family protein [Halococcus salsus]